MGLYHLNITWDMYFVREILVIEVHVQSWRQRYNCLAE